MVIPKYKQLGVFDHCKIDLFLLLEAREGLSWEHKIRWIASLSMAQFVWMLF